MNTLDRDEPEHRVLILTPTGKDGALTQQSLDRAGFHSVVCRNADHLRSELYRGAGLVLITEEAFARDGAQTLTDYLARQPLWSDLPILVMTHQGADSPAAVKAVEMLGNVALLERPVRVQTLVSAVRTALRARLRQYQARAHLVERERNAEEMRILLATLPVGVFIAHDRDCLRITGNRRGSELLRMPMDANLSKTAPPDERPTHFTPCHDGEPIPVEELPIQRAARGEATRDVPVDQHFNDGSLLHTLISASTLYDAAGSPRGAVATIIDITALKNAEDALREADRRKDEFLAVLAHELRNPLAPIRNSLQILRFAASADPAVEQVREIMERQVNHMVRLVDDLLEVSRITRGKIELRKERVDLALILKSAVETSLPLIEAGGHVLETELAGEPLSLDADPVRLAQVFANLLNNAAKYADGPGKIRIVVRRENGRVEVAIRDTGIGIPAEMLPRVFEMFTQLDGAHRRSQGGLGIGLALVQSLVQMHGGTVTAASDGVGRGSEFVVRLPLAAGTAARAVQSPEKAPAINPLKVLVVDDNRDAAYTLGMLLRALKTQVQVVYDGPAALEIIESYHPDLVLLDLGMPGMDGYEVASRIRNQSALRNVTLVALTGWGQEEDRRRTHDAGFDHHLTKPTDLAALQSLMASVERGRLQARSASE